VDADLLDVLRRYGDDARFGNLARKALQFAGGSQAKITHTADAGQSSLWVAKMYRIRMSLSKFKKDRFEGLQESIEALSEREVRVQLYVVETEQVLMSIWLENDSACPLGIVIGRYISDTD
jgi:carbonic anhydrase